MRRERRNSSDISTYSILHLNLDGRIRVDSLKNEAHAMRFGMHSTCEATQAFVKKKDGRNSQGSVNHSEAQKNLCLLVSFFNSLSTANLLKTLSVLHPFHGLSTSRRDNTLFKGVQDAPVAAASKGERRMSERVRAHLCQATCHANAILILFLFEQGVAVLLNLFRNEFGLFGGSFHERVHHGVQDALRSLLCSLISRFFVTETVDANKSKGLFIGHHESMVHHLVQHEAHVAQHGRRGHWVQHELQ
jgi:hypothetical protein